MTIECGRREQKERIEPSTFYLPFSVLDNFSVFTVVERPTKLTPDDSNSAFDTLRIVRHFFGLKLLYSFFCLKNLLHNTQWVKPSEKFFFLKHLQKCRTLTNRFPILRFFALLPDRSTTRRYPHFPSRGDRVFKTNV